MRADIKSIKDGLPSRGSILVTDASGNIGVASSRQSIQWRYGTGRAVKGNLAASAGSLTVYGTSPVSIVDSVTFPANVYTVSGTSELIIDSTLFERIPNVYASSTNPMRINVPANTRILCILNVYTVFSGDVLRFETIMDGQFQSFDLSSVYTYNNQGIDVTVMLQMFDQSNGGNWAIRTGIGTPTSISGTLTLERLD